MLTILTILHFMNIHFSVHINESKHDNVPCCIHDVSRSRRPILLK